MDFTNNIQIQKNKLKICKRKDLNEINEFNEGQM